MLGEYFVNQLNTRSLKIHGPLYHTMSPSWTLCTCAWQPYGTIPHTEEVSNVTNLSDWWLDREQQRMAYFECRLMFLHQHVLNDQVLFFGYKKIQPEISEKWTLWKRSLKMYVEKISQAFRMLEAGARDRSSSGCSSWPRIDVVANATTSLRYVKNNVIVRFQVQRKLKITSIVLWYIYILN